ncbi:C-type lectin domain family 17, member A-like isoform X3 [Mobula birostris]|uniref:C-type lectin domain family 17, member A-like isoform X3 n=1 Tax=Mobula birostris TaxID=1983395 RepID=UPI003B27F006
MDDSETYMNVKFPKTDSGSPSRAEPDVLYAKVNFKTVSEPRARTHPGAPEQESKKSIGSRSCRKVYLLCLIMSILIAIVAGLSIYVSQIRQSQLNSSLQSTISEISDLRHQFTQMETKYKLVNDSMAQICEFLISGREQTCPPDWTEKEGRCFFISTSVKSYDGAREHCSKFDARLLEINSNVEKTFVSNDVIRNTAYWIGKCANGNVASYLLYKLNYGWATCSKCGSYAWSYDCKSEYRFICEKSAYLYPDIPEEIQGLCQQPVGPTSIK